MRQVAYIAACAGLMLVLSGCQGLREAAGFARIEPDEFAISTKAPLIIPPDYNLKPPSPGAPPTNTLEPGDAAEAALFGAGGTGSTPITDVHGQLSAGEQELIAAAGAGHASGAIRARIAADNRKMQTADDSFTNQLLFGLVGTDKPADASVDASAEAARIKAEKEGLPRAAQRQPDTVSKTAPQESDDSWFGGMFDWF